jgi:cytochrome c
MNNYLIPLLLITFFGLIALLIQTLNQVEKANKVIGSDSPAFLQTAKYYIYIPAEILAFVALCTWQEQRYEKEFAVENIKKTALAQFDTAKIWRAPDPLSIKAENEAELTQYGRNLIAHTADYLGPEGSVKAMSNGMNCQNCHLDGASKPFGNNYSAVAATYPKFRARSGTAETIAKRVNDCFQRSLNGQPLDSTSR